jgi:hypothetical protein
MFFNQDLNPTTFIYFSSDEPEFDEFEIEIFWFESEATPI